MSKIILGIDPGITKTGWALVKEEHGKYIVLKTFATSSPGANSSQRKRKKFPMQQLPDNKFQAGKQRANEHIIQLLETMTRYIDDVDKNIIEKIKGIYIESLQYLGGKSQNFNTLTQTSFYIGHISHYLTSINKPINFVNPTVWKKITGNAHADKQRVIRWVETITGYTPPNDHEADAVAIAIFGLNRTGAK